jgi:hypothetical protein
MFLACNRNRLRVADGIHPSANSTLRSWLFLLMCEIMSARGREKWILSNLYVTSCVKQPKG